MNPTWTARWQTLFNWLQRVNHQLRIILTRLKNWLSPIISRWWDKIKNATSKFFSTQYKKMRTKYFPQSTQPTAGFPINKVVYGTIAVIVIVEIYSLTQISIPTIPFEDWSIPVIDFDAMGLDPSFLDHPWFWPIVAIIVLFILIAILVRVFRKKTTTTTTPTPTTVVKTKSTSNWLVNLLIVAAVILLFIFAVNIGTGTFYAFWDRWNGESHSIGKTDNMLQSNDRPSIHLHNEYQMVYPGVTYHFTAGVRAYVYYLPTGKSFWFKGHYDPSMIQYYDFNDGYHIVWSKVTDDITMYDYDPDTTQ